MLNAKGSDEYALPNAVPSPTTDSAHCTTAVVAAAIFALVIDSSSSTTVRPVESHRKSLLIAASLAERCQFNGRQLAIDEAILIGGVDNPRWYSTTPKMNNNENDVDRVPVTLIAVPSSLHTSSSSSRQLCLRPKNCRSTPAAPKEWRYYDLPPDSLVVLGPRTNIAYEHAIVQKESSL
jgi:hypothetical protein